MNEVDKKDNKGLKIVVIVIALIIIIVACVFIFVVPNIKDNKEKENNKKEEQEETRDEQNDSKENGNDEKVDQEESGTSDLVIGKDYIYDAKLEKISSVPKDVTKYEEGHNIGNATVEYSHYGFFGYYLVKKNGSYYLMRNQKEVSKIDFNTLKIYKDNSDKNSKYTSVVCTDNGCDFSFINGDYGHINSYIDEVETAIIYNVNTGKYKIFKNSYVGSIENNESVNFWHEDTENGEGVSLINLDTFELKKLPKNLQLIGDGVSVAAGTGAYSNSSKYIVVKTFGEHTIGKYGLYDYNLNKKIDLIYDDLVTISDDLMIALKGKKYGVINSDNKTIIDFKYDGIINVDNYYVVLLNNKIGVIDKDGKEIVPINYSVYDLDFSLRHCCGDENSFSAEKRVNQIVVTYVDVSKKRDYGRYGYGYSYILINSDNTYKKLDFVNKIYNYANKYYYYDQISDKKINLYDFDRNLYTTLTCEKESISLGSFYDNENIVYGCGFNNHYYNVEQKKIVTEKDINNKYENYIYSEGNLYLYPYGDGYGVYDDNHSLLLEMKKDDKFEHIYGDYYKLTDKNSNVQYYVLKGMYW